MRYLWIALMGLMGFLGQAVAEDNVDLEGATITGNRELPKVLYIVPWKNSSLGDMAARPPNSLMDEALSPVDKEVFERQVDYYGVVKGE